MPAYRVAIVAVALLIAISAPVPPAAQAAGRQLPSVPAVQPLQQISSAWLLGDMQALFKTPSPQVPLQAVLTFTALPYGSSLPQYAVLTILFGNGRATTRTDAIEVWQVAQATPSLFLVGLYTHRAKLAVWALDTYRNTAIDVLHLASTASPAAEECGFVFTAEGQYYTVRGSAHLGPPGGPDLSHAIRRGVDTCK